MKIKSNKESKVVGSDSTINKHIEWKDACTENTIKYQYLKKNKNIISLVLYIIILLSLLLYGKESKNKLLEKNKEIKNIKRLLQNVSREKADIETKLRVENSDLKNQIISLKSQNKEYPSQKNINEELKNKLFNNFGNINKINLCSKSLFHSITPKQECLTEDLLSAFFRKATHDNICINEDYYTGPHYTIQCLYDKSNLPFEYYNKKLFSHLVEKEGINNALSRLTNTRKNVAVFNFWHEPNYGAMFTAYALQLALLKLGYNPYLINNNKRKVNYKYKIFEEDNIFSSKRIANPEALKLLNKNYDNFIVGSDQVWNYKLISSKTRMHYQSFFLDFVNKGKKKIACAASFGDNYFSGPEKAKKFAKEQLESFDSISVREKSGVNICKNTFGVKAEAVYDPVFYLKREEWEQLYENKSNINLKSKCWVYVIYNSKQVNKQIDKILKGTDLTKFRINYRETFLYDFLKSIQISEMVITDSFHVTCFAIIFRRNFVTLIKKGRMEARMISLLTDLGLTDRMFYNLNEVDMNKLKPIDYDKIDRIIEEKRQEGIDFLVNSLEK